MLLLFSLLLLLFLFSVVVAALKDDYNHFCCCCLAFRHFVIALFFSFILGEQVLGLSLSFYHWIPSIYNNAKEKA